MAQRNSVSLLGTPVVASAEACSSHGALSRGWLLCGDCSSWPLGIWFYHSASVVRFARLLCPSGSHGQQRRATSPFASVQGPHCTLQCCPGGILSRGSTLTSAGGGVCADPSSKSPHHSHFSALLKILTSLPLPPLNTSFPLSNQSAGSSPSNAES